MSLSKILNEISDGWIDYRKHCENKNIKGHKIHSLKQDHKIHSIVTKDWKDEISSRVNLKKYKVESSVGKGNLVAGPWLVIMDLSITDAATEGYYIAYLFSRSASKLYLSIGIGGTQFQDIYGMTKKSVEKINEFANNFSDLFKKYKPNDTVDKINLLEDELDFEEPLSGSSRNLNLLFEQGSIFSKEYDFKDINDEDLHNDLKKYIGIYNNIVNDPKSENFDIGAETLIEDENHKNLDLDKQIIEYDYDVKEFEPREKIQKILKKSTTYKAKKKKKTQDSKIIGKKGEDYVYEYEFRRLNKLNKPELAGKIYKHCDNNDFPGWDITSYNSDGTKKYIEVKSSRKNKRSFTITSNEWNAAKREKEKYYIYIVSNALNKKIKIEEIIKNPLKFVEEGKIFLEISEYDFKI